jgi:hypothetical protein
MRDIQKLNRLLAELGTRYSIANLKLPSHGAVGLRLKDGSELYLEYEEEQGKLYAYASVIDVPKDDAGRLKLFAAMLDLNYLGAGLRCGTLSIQNERAICHVSLVIADLQLDAFDRALQDLIAARSEMRRI